MANTSIQTAIHERVDPVLEAMIYGLVERASRPKTSVQAEGDIAEGLALALVRSLMTPPLPRGSKRGAGVTPFGIVLASALAVDLAPAIAQALTPAIVQALGTVASRKRPGQEQEKLGQGATSGVGSDQREHHQ